ncbi:hypothetical protein [Sphingobacterium kitahiroshimense]|uniref:Uncharacterized protein n=1 Tax=Sphingobacterium kitahiroshimense TaxID=470446 RepID=A0ABV0BP70_9SPHI
MEKQQEELYNLTDFYTFINKLLNALFYDQSIINRKMQEVDAILKNEKIQLTGKAFFTVIQRLGLDLPLICQHFFKHIPVIRLKYPEYEIKKLSDIFLNTHIAISAATNLEASPLSEIFNKNYDHLLAYEVYALATAVGIETYILFDYLYGNKKKKLILRLEIIDDGMNSKEKFKSLPDHEIIPVELPIQKFIRKKNISREQKRQLYSILDYMIHYTDFFLTDRTAVEITKEIENNYQHFKSPLPINNLMSKFVGNELTRIKINTIKTDGEISKKEKFIYTKASKKFEAVNEIDRYVKPEDRSRVVKFNNYKNTRLKNDKEKEKAEMEAVDKLYDIIATNPGQPLSFYLTITDIKVRTLELQLQKLLDAGRLEYCDTTKPASYWPVNRND